MSVVSETALSELLVDATPGFACGEDVEDGVFQFRMNNITTEGQLDLSKRRRVPRALRNIDRFALKRGDVLFNATNSPDLVGKAAFFPGLEESAVFSNHFLRLRPRDGQADGRYLARWLNLQFQRGRFKAMCRQWVNQATVGRDALLSLRLPLPPLPEQRRIAEILDKADALRAKRRAALALLDTLNQSIFPDMFGDPATVLHRWPVSKLGQHLEFLTSGSRGWAKHYSERGDIFLRIQNVRRDELSLDDIAYIRAPDTAEARRTRVEAGDVLLSITADLGRTAVVPKGLGNAFINQHLAILRTKSFVPRFLSAYLASPAGRSQMLRQNRQAVKAGLNFGDIRGFLVPFPPVTIQRKFEATAAAVGASQRAQSAALSRLDLLFTSLQHRAFRGEL